MTRVHFWVVVIMVAIKDMAQIFLKRLYLSNSMIISHGGKYRINGVQGQLTKFGWFRITLRETNGAEHHIPMDRAVNGTITRLDRLKKEKT